MPPWFRFCKCNPTPPYFPLVVFPPKPNPILPQSQIGSLFGGRGETVEAKQLPAELQSSAFSKLRTRRHGLFRGFHINPTLTHKSNFFQRCLTTKLNPMKPISASSLVHQCSSTAESRDPGPPHFSPNPSYCLASPLHIHRITCAKQAVYVERVPSS